MLFFFPSQNKEFVYRGSDFEKLPSFTRRLREEFPHASVLQYNDRTSNAAENGEDGGGGDRILVCGVQPEAPEAGGGGAGEDDAEGGFPVPDKVRRSRARMDVRRFRHDRPFHLGARDPGNEFKTLWIERTHLATSSGFPGLLRWQEVAGEPRTERVPPLVHACESVEAKTAELRRLAADADAPDGNAATVQQRLSLSLQGVVDAAVNGGVAKYREAFLSHLFGFAHTSIGYKRNLLSRSFSPESW